MSHLAPYFLLAFWTSVASVLQALASDVLGLGAFTPDLPLLLLVAAISVLHRRDPVRIALVAGGARAMFTIEPPFAVLAGTLAAGIAADAVRRFAELSGPWVRASLAGGVALAFHAWLVAVHAARVESLSLPAARAILAGAPWALATASATAALALVAWRSLTRLPGLRALRRRAF